LVLVWLISFFKESHLAAHSIMSRCISLSFQPTDGPAAVLTLVGRSLGSGDYLLVRRYTRAGFLLIADWMTTMALIYVIPGNFIIRLFTADPAIIPISQQVILRVAAFLFFDAMNVTYVNALTGAGDTVCPSAVNLALSLVVLLGGGLAMVILPPRRPVSRHLGRRHVLHFLPWDDLLPAVADPGLAPPSARLKKSQKFPFIPP
jgi:Na+-driven multidrug efflux pump